MCGITGIFAFNLVGKFNKIHITAATMSLEKRGPDFQDIYIDEWVGLGHRRLSVIDTSEKANQPMWDSSGRYCIVFNGEIFNYRELRRTLEAKGMVFRSESDTEVLLQAYILDQEACLEKLNGFFAFCIYDKHNQSFFLARDRFGVKPLLYLFDEDKFIFASEMKSMLRYGIDKALDYTSLVTYLQLNYIPAPDSILTNVKKLLPGHYLKIESRSISVQRWYTIPREKTEHAGTSSYDAAKARFASLLETAVQRRLVADVPLGAFLSGGVDSSVITGLASRHKPDIQTFSIGFKDAPFFDETAYAREVSKHFNTHHTVFSLTNKDLFAHLNDVLQYTDEPFADSSAINVYILSKETRKHATVALSGDGADELLGGYNKHEAFYRMLNPGWQETAIALAGPLWKRLPRSRNNPLANGVRQALRFAEGFKLTPADRYWRWATFTDLDEARSLLAPVVIGRFVVDTFEQRKQEMLTNIYSGNSMDNILRTDIELVLANDMLVKVDLMSMANGLEVRSPFLDYEVVEFECSLPDDFKITKGRRKRILQDAFRDMLPARLYNRPKKGFEVPMLGWLRHELRERIEDDLLSKRHIEEQGLFNYPEVHRLKKKLFSNNPGDVPARIWGLVVFQSWFKKYLN